MGDFFFSSFCLACELLPGCRLSSCLFGSEVSTCIRNTYEVGDAQLEYLKRAKMKIYSHGPKKIANAKKR